MAEDSTAISPPSSGTRTGPVLVPQASLLGKPDISLSRSVITVGSRESSRIHLVSRSISSYHALFINSTGTVAVCDLASRTGVLVNARQVKYAELKNGDLVQIGKFLFRFRAPKPEAVAGPPDPAVLDVPGDLPVSLADTRRLIIGRRETCDLPLTDDTDVSTLHAVLFQHDGNWIMRDLDSRTGTRLNGIRIHQAKVAFGDTIKIGKTTFKFSPATEVLSTPSVEEDITFSPTDASFESEPVAASESAQAPTMDIVDAMETEPADAGAMELEPIDIAAPAETLATANVELPLDRPGEPEEFVDEPSPETFATAATDLPLEPADLSSVAADDTLAAEAPPVVDDSPPDFQAAPTPVEPADLPAAGAGDFLAIDGPIFIDEEPADAGALELGSASAFDLPLELDIAEAPPTIGATANTESPLEPAEVAPADTGALELGSASAFDLPLELDIADAPPAIAATVNTEAPLEPAEETPADIGALELGSASTFDLPLELDIAEAPPATTATVNTEAPLEPAEVAPADIGAIELGSASTFDLPLELDVAEAPPIPESTIDELTAAVTVDDEIDLPDFSTPAAVVAEPAPGDELAPPVLTEAAASPPPLQPVEKPTPEPVDDTTETVDFGEPLPPEPPPAPVKPARKRVAKKAAEPKEPKQTKPRRGGRKKSVTPIVMDVVDTLANEAVPELPVVAGGSLLPEVAAAMELADGLPPVESIETGAMLAITPAAADEPTLTMTESMPATPGEPDAGPAVVHLSDTGSGEPVDTRDMSLPPDHDVVFTTSTGLTTEQLLVETDTDIAPADSTAEDDTAVHEPSELLDEPASLHVAASEAFAELAELGDEEEFVAIPDPEPAGQADDEITFTDVAPPAVIEVDEPAIAEVIDEPLEPASTESVDEVATSQPIDAVDDSTMLSDDVAPVGPDSAGPPIFGFDFGGGSFLGGMPLSLQPPPPSFGKVSHTFDRPPSSPAMPPATSLHAEFEPAAPVPSTPTTPPPPAMTAPAALVDMDASSLLSFDEPYTTQSSAGPMAGVVNVDDAPLTAFDPPDQSPPSPHASDDQTITSTTSRPAINTLADEVAIPPLTSRAADAKVAPRPQVTTAFDGLASGLGASSAAAMNVDVFSQQAPPIRDELFGSRGDKPEDVVLPRKQPESRPSAPRRDPPPQVQIPPIDRIGPSRPGSAEPYRDEDDDRPDRDYQRNPPDRFARLPTLALLMLLCLIAAGMMIYFFLPPPVEVVGTLTFANLSKQPVTTQRQFAIGQVQRLESGDVRNVARSIATSKSVGTGFLDEDLEFAKVTANADWDGDVMTLHQTATDEYAARTRLMALLEALGRKDADLNDNLASARAAAAAARDAVTNQQQEISRIRADRETQVRIGDAAPRLEDVAVVERKANMLDAAWVAAKTRRADAQLTLDKLRQLDPATAADPKDDPLLGELHQHQQEADVRLAVARATASKPTTPPPAFEVDLNALVADVAQTREAINKRMALLLAEKNQSPEQRIASRQAAIEAQSVKLATLQAAETDAATAAQAAAIAARDQRAMLDAGRMASIRVEDLIHRQEAAEQTLKELSQDQAAKDDAVNLCVQVAALPKVDTKPGRDLRPVSYAMAGGAILLLFGVIAVASTRPVVVPVHVQSAAVPAAPIPVFGANRKPRPETNRPREAATPKSSV